MVFKKSLHGNYFSLHSSSIFTKISVFHRVLKKKDAFQRK